MTSETLSFSASPAAPVQGAPETSSAVGTVTLSVNGEKMHVPAGTDLASALATLGDRLDAQRCATAVNGQFVPKAARATRVLVEGDAVTTFQAIVGG